MYLLVFVTLVISLIGIYAQTLSVQAARFAAGQSTVAQAMMAWHAAAIGEAKYGVYLKDAVGDPGPFTPSASGCSMTMSLALSGAFPWCPSTDTFAGVNAQAFVTAKDNQFASLPDCSTTTPPNKVPCWTGLPPGYVGGSSGTYTFYSIYYTPAGINQSYVITFVPPPTLSAANPAPGFISLPKSGGKQLGITMSDLLNQLRNANAPVTSYGLVKNSILSTVGINNGTATASLQYPIPTDGCPANCTVPDGSIAIVSSP